MADTYREVRSFAETLKELRQGGAIADLTASLCDVVAAVRATGGAGKLVFSIVVKPLHKGDVTMLTLVDDVKVKLPAANAGLTVMYATEENGLTRHDPRQPELAGLRAVATVTPMTREGA